MTTITDKIKQLCEKIKKLTPARSSLEHWMTGPDCEGEKEYYGELCTPNDIATLQALVSELETAKRALEKIANWETQYSSVPEDFISIATAALEKSEKEMETTRIKRV